MQWGLFLFILINQHSVYNLKMTGEIFSGALPPK